MRPIIKRHALAAVIAATVLAIAACGSSNTPAQQSSGSASTSGSAQPHQGGTITIGTNTDVFTFDPAKCYLGTRTQCEAVYGILLAFDSDTQQFVPEMAKSFTSSSDGLTWTLDLRPNVKFSDGTPFDADAVVYNWNRIKDPKVGSPSIGVAGNMTWTVTDPLTVTIKLKTPDFQLPWQLTYNFGLIGSPKAIKAEGDDIGTKPVGAGPFVLKSWQPQSLMQFSRNTTYWDAPRPYIDNLNFKIITADDLRAQALQNNEIQIDLNFDGRYSKQLTDAGYIDAVDKAVVGSGVSISTLLPDVKDPEVRKAFAELIDPQQIQQALYPGDDVATSLIRDGLPYSGTVSAPTPNKDDAQKLIDDYLSRTGEKQITVDFKFANNSASVQQLAQLVQAQLQQAKGVKVNVVPLEPAAVSAQTAAGQVAMDQGGIFGSNPDLIYDTFDSQGASNAMRYSNPDVDKQLELWHSAPTADQRNTALSAAADLITQDNVLIPYRRTDTHWTYGSHVHGVVARDGIVVDVTSLWIDG